MATVRKLKLKRFGVTNAQYQYFSAYRLRIEVAEAQGVDDRIFVYRRAPANAYTGVVTDTFFSIASPVDLEEYPPGTPDPSKAFPFFRQNFVELDFRSVTTAMDAWQKIVQEVNILIQALDRMEQLELIEEFWVGPFTEDPTHDSASVEP